MPMSSKAIKPAQVSVRIIAFDALALGEQFVLAEEIDPADAELWVCTGARHARSLRTGREREFSSLTCVARISLVQVLYQFNDIDLPELVGQVVDPPRIVRPPSLVR